MLNINALFSIILLFFCMCLLLLFGNIFTLVPPILNFRVRIRVRFKTRLRFRIRVRVKDRVRV